MYKVLLIWIVIAISVNANTITVNEKKVDIWFGNGVWNTRSQARESLAYLEEEIIKPYITQGDNKLEEKYLPLYLAYNQNETVFLDLIETFYQMKNAGQISEVLFFATVDKLLAENITNVVGGELEDLREVIVLHIMQTNINTLEEIWRKSDGGIYETSFLPSHRVLYISHSQGNMFVNQLYEQYIEPMGYGKYFANLQIASTAHKISALDEGIGAYVTNCIDPIINPLPGSMSCNASPAFGHTLIGSYLDGGSDSSVARGQIIEYVKNFLAELDTLGSQWKIKSVIGCGCSRHCTVQHKFNGAAEELMRDKDVMQFNETGKLYQLYDETNSTLYWVKGDANGTAVKNEQEHLPGVCYSLTGTEEIIKGSANPEPTDGVLRVVLDWDKKDIDLDLSIDGPTAGVKEEHPEYECPRENWYVANESGLAKGDYIVSVTAPSSVDQALMPEKVRIDVKAIGKGEYIGIDINDSALLNLGEVYKIQVEVPTQGGGGASSSIRRVTVVPVSSTVPYHEDNDGTIYTADLFLLLKQVAMGPIAGASLLLEKLNNGEWQGLYTGVTTSGATINSNGLIIFPASLQESVLASDILLLSASGGHDVDADDDLNMDETPTVVLGKLHAFIDAENIAGNNFKVNILTEIAYQAIRNRLDENTTKEALFAMLDGVSKLLIKNDLNDDSTISYKDAATWLASFDKEKLQFDYNEKIEPIVQKIYSGEDIYLDVYKLLYAGKIDGLQVDNNSTENTLRLELNSYADLSQLQKEDFVLKDSSGNSVDFTFAIVDGKVVIDPLNDLVEGESYTLSFDLKISDDQDNVFVDTQLHTFIVPDITPPVIPESTIHINENYGSELPFNASDPSTPLTYSIVGGTDSALFEIKNVFVGYGMYADRIYFKEMPNYERPSDSNGDNIYELDISVADSFENVTTQSIRIVVDDVKEGPLLADTNMTVNENMPIGTYVGTMTVLNEGDGNLTNFYLSDENFRIDREGKIYTKIIFDYERISEFKLGIRAKNSVGAWAITKNAFVTITDVPEPLPEVHAFTGSMDDHAPQGKVVGQLYVYPGLDATAEVRLTGEGAEDFDVNSTGHVTVSATADLDHKIRRQYDLKAIASNSYGESNEANVTIYVNVWTKQIGTEFRDYTRATTVDNDNNFYLTGVKNYNSPEQGTTFISKYNSTGQLMWSYENNQSEKIRFWSITVDQNGTVFVTGAKATGRTYVSYNYTYESYASWILALSSQGKVLWTRVLDNGATGSDYLETAFIDPQGDVIASGRTYGAFPGYEKNGVNVFFTKFSKLGDKEWIKQFNMPSYNTQVTPLGEFYFESGNRIIKFDSNLESITWEKEFIISDIANTYYDGVNFTLDNDGNILFLCRQYTWVEWNINSNYFYEDDYDSVIVKFNQDGEFLWLKNYGSDKYEYPSVIKVNNKNEIYFAGDTRGNYYNNINKAPYLDPEEVGDVFLTKLDADGNMLDSKQFGSIGWDSMNTIAIDNNNDVYMTGGVNDSLDGNVHLGGYDMFIMKVPY